MATVIDLTDATYDSEVAKTGRTLVILFWSTADAASRMMIPIIDQLAGEYSSITFARVDVASNSGAASKAGVVAVPTIVAFQNSQRVAQMLGVRSKGDVARVLDGL